MRNLWKNYSLTIVLTGLALLFWVIQWYTGWQVYVADQLSHESTPSIFGAEGYIHHFWQATSENWTSEFVQLGSFVLLSAIFEHKKSPQSKDGDEEMQRKIDQIGVSVFHVLERLDKITTRLDKLEGIKRQDENPIDNGYVA